MLLEGFNQFLGTDFYGTDTTNHFIFSSCNIIRNKVCKVYLNQHFKPEYNGLHSLKEIAIDPNHSFWTILK